MTTYSKDSEGRMELTLEEYSKTDVWPCCGQAVCVCGKARHPRPIRDMISEAALHPTQECDE